jgi:hypothetical protein
MRHLVVEIQRLMVVFVLADVLDAADVGGGNAFRAFEHRVNHRWDTKSQQTKWDNLSSGPS